MVEGNFYLIEAATEAMIPIFHSLDQDSHSLDFRSSICYSYIMDRTDLLKAIAEGNGPPTTGNDFQIQALHNREHALTILNNWKYKHPFAEHFFEFTCRNGLALGAFNDKDEICSWGTFTWYGYLGAHMTRLDARKRGLYSRIGFAQARMAVEILEQDAVAVFVGVKNHGVIKGLTSLGFRRIGSPAYFIGLNPKQLKVKM